jgi:5'-nucleotidase
MMFLLAGLPVYGESRPRAGGAFTILQINDVYKIEGLEDGDVGGLARVRTLRKQLEARGRPVLFLIAGDLLFPSVMSKYLRAQPMIKCLNLLDGDPARFDPKMVSTFGNHEFDDLDPGLLLGRLAQSDFRWVSSNVRYRSDPSDTVGGSLSGRLKNVDDTLVIEIGGVRVGLFGLTVDAQRREYIGYDYSPITARRAAVRKAIAQLRARQVRMIIALTHQMMPDDMQMAAEFPAIDLVVGGHEHFYQERKVGHTWITKADSDAQTAVQIDVSVPGRGLASASPHKLVLDKSVAKDATVDAEVQKWLAQLSKSVKQQTGHDPMEVVGSTENALEGVEPAIRGRETALGNFLADVVRARMKTQVAFINGGAIRINDNIPAGGPVRAYDLEGIFLFGDDLVSFDLTGLQLLDVLRNSVAEVDEGSGQFLQVSGVRFHYHRRGTPDKPTYIIEPADVQVIQPDGMTYATIDPAARYSVSTLDYVWANGSNDGYKVFSQGNGGSSPPRTDTGPAVSWRQATEDAISALPAHRITSRIEGRIVRDQQ